MRLRQFAVMGALLGLVGCAADRPDLVPDSAMLKAQGNDRVVYVAEDAGNVWVADKDAQAIVYSGRLQPRDRLVIDTRADRITINDRAVTTRALGRRDYKVFFEPGLTVPASATVSPRETNRDELKRPDAVPAAAVLVGEGRNRIEYTASDDGEVWVANADRNSVVYSGRVVRGEQIVIDSDKDRLEIGGRTVWADRGDLPGDNHRIFFARRGDLPRDALLTPVPAAERVRSSRPDVVVVERPRDIPEAAIVWSESEDRTELVAIDPGTAWVVDGSGRAIYSKRLVPGDKLEVDPVTDQITLNGRGVYDGRIAAGRYRVFFDKTSR